MKRKRYKSYHLTPDRYKDRFTYQRTFDEQNGTRIIFMSNGQPFFKNPIPCTPEQALTLVRKLNAIEPKKFHLHVKDTINKWDAEVKRYQQAVAEVNAQA